MNEWLEKYIRYGYRLDSVYKHDIEQVEVTLEVSFSTLAIFDNINTAKVKVEKWFKLIDDAENKTAIAEVVKKAYHCMSPKQKKINLPGAPGVMLHFTEDFKGEEQSRVINTCRTVEQARTVGKQAVAGIACWDALLERGEQTSEVDAYHPPMDDKYYYVKDVLNIPDVGMARVVLTIKRRKGVHQAYHLLVEGQKIFLKRFAEIEQNGFNFVNGQPK